MKRKIFCTLLILAVLVFAFSGFIGNFYVKAALIDGTEISSGLYLMAQHTAYSEARAKLEGSEKDVLKQQIDGQSASTWIKARTEELLRKYVLVLRMCRERDITISYEGQQNIDQMLQMWPYMQDMYSENGISESTMRRYSTNEQLAFELFMALYGKDGELAPKDSELKDAYAQQHAHVRYLMIPITSLVEGVDVSQEMNTRLEELLEKLRQGASLEEIELDDLPQLYSITQRPYEVPEQSAISSSYISYQQDSYATYSEEFLALLKGQSEGEYGTYTLNSTVLLYEKIPTFQDDEEFEAMRETVLSATKMQEYEDYLRDIYNQYPVQWVFGARFYLSPRKIKE